MLVKYILIGLGGALGAVARVFLSKLVPAGWLGMPFNTIIINVIGCFLAGFCVSLMSGMYTSDTLRQFLIAGCLGGFTTFSAFAVDVGGLMTSNNYIAAIGYIVISIFFSLVAFVVGIRIG